ncbi:MAG: hypothetical protein E7443_01840 [Ruminococcaceae bacterium]|nr:hypothetical protein [Oscillospiraceae bacterium]
MSMIHEEMSWQTLNQASTFEEPFKDYPSVFDKTKETYPFQKFEEDLFALQKQYPDLMRIEIAGYSELGRPIYVVVMGKDTAPNRMLVMATTHAREYVATQLSVLQIEFYLRNYDKTINGERIADLLERCQFYFMPLHNPDGAELSMRGLKSLDDPKLTISAEDKAELRKFLLGELDPMHEFCENHPLYHASDAEFYSHNPDPERENAFMYWKCNIRGIDLHNSMYTAETLEAWKEAQAKGERVPSTFTNFPVPGWQNYMGTMDLVGVELSAENRVLSDYVAKVKPNLLVSYHTASNVIQWNYAYSKLGDSQLLENATSISCKASDLLNFEVDDREYMLMGHPGWFMKETLNYMPTCGYGVTIELATRRYLDNVGSYPEGYIDTPPTKIIQLTEDVVTNDGKQRYSLWTTGKFFPLALSQYIMDNHLIPELTFPAAQ